MTSQFLTPVAAVLVLSACAAPEPSLPASTTSVSGAATPSFVNKVWVVAESKDVALGELRVFLSEGTLVMASPHATPAFGRWLTQYNPLNLPTESQVDGLAVEADTRRADDVASIGMVGPMVELLRIRRRVGTN